MPKLLSGTMDLELALLGVLSFGLAITLTGQFKATFQTKLLDIPNDRSSHTQPTPRGGGLGFCIAFGVTSLLAWGGESAGMLESLSLSSAPVYSVLVLLPLAIVGLLDDRFNIPARIRYAVQLGAAMIALLSFGVFPLPGLPDMFWATVLVSGITLIGFTALINFYNFMDGLDGLVASVTAVQLGFLAFYLHQPLWWLMVAALLGFLWWNWSPAKIFMGDVGSTVLGACMAIALLASSPDPARNLAALAITLPLTADAIYTLIRRLWRRENIFQAHRTHLYQRLQQSGWSHRQVAITYLLWTGAIALLIQGWQGWGSLLSLGLSSLLIIFGEAYLSRQPSPVTPSSP
ncbi:MAG: glycosyltransferase family 4 protein [Cyanobacteria bacterium P01_H01_bin.153]